MPKNLTGSVLEQISKLIRSRDNNALLKFLTKEKDNLPNAINENSIPSLLLDAASFNNLEAIIILAEYGVNFDISIEGIPILDYLMMQHVIRKTNSISYGEVALLLNSLGINWDDEITAIRTMQNRQKYENFFNNRPEFAKTQEFIAKYYFFACEHGLAKSVESFLILAPLSLSEKTSTDLAYIQPTKALY